MYSHKWNSLRKMEANLYDDRPTNKSCVPGNTCAQSHGRVYSKKEIRSAKCPSRKVNNHIVLIQQYTGWRNSTCDGILVTSFYKISRACVSQRCTVMTRKRTRCTRAITNSTTIITINRACPECSTHRQPQ